MASDAAAIVARARALVGVRFRPQGRCREHGLDCLGVVAAAMEIGAELVPDDYALRGGEIGELEDGLVRAGFLSVPGEAEAGDVLIARSGPGQLHAVVLTPGGHVHAHAGLRRVVETPGVPPWSVLGAWRLAGRGR